MRYDKEHKQRTRNIILQEAATVIRERGPENVGIKSIMSNAGLTVGGFYAHFKSKNDLVAAAIEVMFDERRAALMDCLEGRPPLEGLSSYVDYYLSERHSYNFENGCPLPVLSAYVARLPAKAKESFYTGMKRRLQVITAQLELLGHQDPESSAISIVSEMVGALALSRTVVDQEYRRKILAVSRASVKARLKP